MALVRERTIPTERPPPVGEVSANNFARNWEQANCLVCVAENVKPLEKTRRNITNVF
jgi:hypothetical protein